MFPDNLTKTAKQLVEYCNTGESEKGLNELYAPEAVSVEAVDMMGMGRQAQGLDAIRGKHQWWYGAHEVHSSTAEGPFLYGEDQFGIIFAMDVTTKETGDRMQGRELGVYTVNSDGKIIKEEFFYGM